MASFNFMKTLSDIYKRHDKEVDDLKAKVKTAREELEQGANFYWKGKITDEDMVRNYVDNCIARLKEIEGE